MQDKESDTWIQNGEDDIEEEEKDVETESEDETVEEKREDVDAESEKTDEVDLSASFMGQFEARRKKELTTKSEEKRKQLRQLIRVT